MAVPELSAFYEPRPAAMVVGHARSGTHFLMSTLAAGYGYVNVPHLDLDLHHININYFHPPEISKTLLGIAAGQSLATVVKSHHAVEFFDSELPRITERFVVFYLYRDPVAVLLSFWRFMHRLNWKGGPKTPDPVAFASSEPYGQMMRYQMRQYPNLMLRWAAHVEGWLDAAKDQPRIVPIRYEDLNTQYESTVRAFAKVLENQPKTADRSALAGHYIKGASLDDLHVSQSDFDNYKQALRTLCERTVGSTMARCGYLPSKGGGLGVPNAVQFAGR